MPKKQKDGRYRSKVTIGYTVEGKPVYKYVSGKTKRELEVARKEAEAYYINGAAQRADMLFADYAQAWYHAKKEPVIGTSSQQAYLTCLNQHILPAFGGRMLRAIQYMEMQQWLNGYAGMSKTRLTMLRSIVRNVYACAYAEGIVQYDPARSLTLPKAGEPVEKRAFTEEECARIEAIIPTHRYGLFLAVLYHLGVRRGEALGLQWGDINWQTNKITISRDVDYTEDASGKTVGELKSKAAYRTIPVPDDLIGILREHRGLPHIYLFGTDENYPISRTSYQRRWMDLMIAAGFATPVEKSRKKGDIRFDYDCKITPHYFRHNYATMLYNAGVDSLTAMKILGHSSYSITAKIYTHLDNTHIDAAAEKINANARKTKVAEKLPKGSDGV